jgi:hypothetical protein
MTNPAIPKYLGGRTDLGRRPLVCAPCDGVKQVVVIPVLAERQTLFKTLEDLAANPPEELERTMVICVVNNRAEPHADPADIAQNAETLYLLQSMAEGAPTREVRSLAASPLRLGYIDASSQDFALRSKDGVGLARKIGLDWGVAVLARNGADRGGLLSLDADTRVEPSYLAAARAHFDSPGSWAGIFEYAHPISPPAEEARAIVCYELFLRYHTLGLKYAGSPYAFHTIGSTIGCTVEAYVAVSGMNRRQAGEDFYFLQKLAKTGPVKRISGTTVWPSSRASHRVPFGTGARVRRFVAGEHDEYLLYHPESYGVLKKWLACAAAHGEEEADTVLDAAGRIAPPLAAFLSASGFAETWPRLQENSRDTEAFLKQFHVWFDGFRTLKLIHHLRDHGYPEQGTFQAIQDLLALRGDAISPGTRCRAESNLNEQQAILCQLRAIDENGDGAGEPNGNHES